MEPRTLETETQNQELASWSRERSDEELSSFVSRLNEARFSDIEL